MRTFAQLFFVLSLLVLPVVAMAQTSNEETLLDLREKLCSKQVDRHPCDDDFHSLALMASSTAGKMIGVILDETAGKLTSKQSLQKRQKAYATYQAEIQKLKNKYH